MSERKIIFLDRDGVINHEPGTYTFEIERFVFLPQLFETLQSWQAKGYDFIIITNQGGISKKIYTHREVEKINELLREKFSEQGLSLLDIYYCPHHSINEKCICRKPDALMLEKAIAKYNVDKAKSYFIGDSQTDMQAAQRAGVTGVKIIKNDVLKNYIDQIC